MPALPPRSTSPSRRAWSVPSAASIPPLVQTLTQNRNALALLIARPPEHVRIRGGSLRGLAFPRVTPGLPSELLTQRPDIREAEANLAAANANVANARAQFLPSITLTGEGGFQSAMLADPAAAGIGVLHAHRRADAADLRGRQAARQSRPAERQAGRVAAELPQGGDLRFHGRGERARRRAADRDCASGCRPRWWRARAAPSTFPSSACARARSISSPCCRPSRRLYQARGHARCKRGSRISRPSSASIRRSAAAGCRNRWTPPMHGKLPKEVLTKRKAPRAPLSGDRARRWSPWRRRSPMSIAAQPRSSSGAAVSPPKDRCRCWSPPPRPPTCRSIWRRSAPSKRSTP